MDVRTRLAQAIHHVMSTKASSSTPIANQISIESELIKSSQLALDQFTKSRTDFVKQMGAYSLQSENLKSLALLMQSGENTASEIMRDLSRLINEGISRNFTALFNQQHSEAYITALLIQSFGMLDKKLKVLRRQKKESEREKPNKEEKEDANNASEEEIQYQLVSAEQACTNLLEGLLTHADNHSGDQAFYEWAKKSVEITKQQLTAQNIPIDTNLTNQFSMVQDVIIALENGMSVSEIRQVLINLI